MAKQLNLTLFTNQQISRLVQIESICRRHIKCSLKNVLERVENIVRKGENVGYQHFLFPCFQNASMLRSLIVWIVW